MTDIATDETLQLIASDKVEGTAVYNPNGDRLGTISNLMVDKLSGQVDYAVMSFGGFLGIGEDYYPLPWNKLTYSTSMGGYVVDIDPRVLERAPRYGASERPNWSDRRYTSRIDDYWTSVPPV